MRPLNQWQVASRCASGEAARADEAYLPMRIVRRRWPLRVSQIMTFGSPDVQAPVTIDCPSGVNATLVTGPLCPTNGSIGLPVSVSQSITQCGPFAPAVANDFESGAKYTL